MSRSSADAHLNNFTPVVAARGFAFVSGQASVENGQVVSGSFAEELDRSTVGLGMADVVKVTAYVRDPGDIAEFNRLYRTYFEAPLPARTSLTNCLSERLKFEVDAIALADGSREA